MEHGDGDVDAVVLGIQENPLCFQIVTLGLHQVLVLPAIQRAPYLVRRRPPLVLETKGGVIQAVLAVIAPRHVLVEGFHIHPVDLCDPPQLLRRGQVFVNLDL